MHRGTRELIKERNRHSSLPVEQVLVQSVALGTERQCFMNAHNHKSSDVLRSGSTKNPMVSGWMSYPYNAAERCCEFVQHWWNFDPVAHRYFDTTPFLEGVDPTRVEYVLDNDIRDTGMEYFSKLASNVGRDVILRDGKWYWVEVDSEGEPKLEPLPDLQVKRLLIFR